MKESTKNILVLGSKPNSFLPDLKVDNIYSANGAAERASIYKKKYLNTPHTCCAGAFEFSGNENVRNRILQSNSDRIVTRMGKIQVPNDYKRKCKIECLSKKENWEFQKSFFQFKGLTLLAAEACYRREKFYETVIYFLKCIKQNRFQGMSTGFFAILLALKENPDANIIVSGIGMSGGAHFYSSERVKFRNYTPRSKVDRYLINRIDKRLKKRIFSMDKEFVDLADINYWNGSIF